MIFYLIEKAKKIFLIVSLLFSSSIYGRTIKYNATIQNSPLSDQEVLEEESLENQDLDSIDKEAKWLTCLERGIHDSCMEININQMDFIIYYEDEVSFRSIGIADYKCFRKFLVSGRQCK